MSPRRNAADLDDPPILDSDISRESSLARAVNDRTAA
jgi:hypothetical protein